MFASRRFLRGLKCLLCVCLLVGAAHLSSAFVLIGIPNPNELAVNGGAINNNLGPGGAVTFGYGGPKDIKRFFRWNIPYLVYSFDASFINYFGFEGMEAVHDSFRVLNDFFVPEDGSYNGMSGLDLSRHGFIGNHNTTWVNTTAQNAQIIDLKSLVLGMLVNHLGLGNPHRHAFTVTGATTAAWTPNQLNFQIRLRNYDPNSLKETDIVNGVQYAYRLVHDGIPAAGGALPAVTVVDVEEYTADTSGNAWTSVAAIADAFYGETMIYWTDMPTLFDFGVYYDGMNAMGGQYQPRHALTYDDAGGFKYLYATNTYAWETMDASVGLIQPAQFLPTTQEEMKAINANWSGIPAGLNFQNNTGKRLPVWPRRGTTIPSFRYTTPIFGQPVINSTPGNSWVGGANNIGPGDLVMRGGIDKMQFYFQPLDSLLGLNFIPTNFVWSYPFVAQNGYNVGGLTNTTPGAGTWLGQQLFKFATLTVGRTVTQPDLFFMADDLGLSVDGVPIAYQRPNNANWTDNAAANWATYFTTLGGAFVDPNYPGAGPGTIDLGGVIGTFNFTKIQRDFELIWSGETSVVGNQESYYSLWGHIKGPGPNDLVIFPRDATMWRVENQVIPDASPPVITLISDDGGATPIEQDTYTRTEETLTIIGSEMASVTAIEIMNGDLVVHTIMPVDNYIQSNTRIDLPAGLLGETAEGAALELRVWNSVGASQKGVQKFTIETGRPIITSTSADNIVYDRAETLTIRGYGFKSRTAGQTRLAFIRMDDSTGAAVYDNGVAMTGTSDGVPAATANIEVVDDTTAVLPLNAVNFRADGSTRRLRVSRATAATANVDLVLSPPSNPFIIAVTTKPVMSSINQIPTSTGAWEDITATGMFKRDEILEINGTALNTLDIIEVVQENGGSFANPVFIQLPNAAVSVEDNGTRVLVGANAIPYPDADTNASVRRFFRLYNAASISDLNGSLMFVVNTQPKVTGMSAFATTGFFNRDKDIGDDVAIFGSGLQAIGEIHIIDANGSDIDAASIPRMTLPHPGVTVTDTQIDIDTQVAQFANSATADTDINNTARIFKLVSARDNATTPLVNRFGVGVPPSSVGSIWAGHWNHTAGWPGGGGNGLTTENHYFRSFDTLYISGSGLGMATQVEIVDMFGNQIPGAVGVTTSTGLNIHSGTMISIDPNATGWAGVSSLLDHTAAFGRRIKVTTPFGVSTSNATQGGAFTVSGRPEFGATAQDTFAGGGYDGGTNTYTQGAGDLVINGTNFRGVNRVTFIGGGTTNVDIDPNNPPAGYAVSADGTQLTVQSGVIPAHWIGGAGRYIRLRVAASQYGYTQAITTN